jgi:NAD(P)-dependent dehydrogenase (short-subunit alcohol dehydrogenase family)
LINIEMPHEEPTNYKEVARPQELANAVYFLASPESEWASGAVLDFNGASYLRM